MATTHDSPFSPPTSRFSLEQLFEWIGRLTYTLLALPVAVGALLPVSLALAADRLVSWLRREAIARAPRRAGPSDGVDVRAA